MALFFKDYGKVRRLPGLISGWPDKENEGLLEGKESFCLT